ncbi:MAG: radical SAM protein [Pseudomonadota bacterium]
MAALFAENKTAPKDQAYEFSDSRNISRLVSDKGDPNRIIAAEIGPRYEDYRRRWDLARSFQVLPPFPLQIDFELFYRCNLKCPICLMSLPPEEKLRWGDPALELPLEKIKALVDEGAERGLAAVGLNGICEPLLSPHLPEIIRHARSRGVVDVMFNTNGLALTEKLARDLIASGLTRIMFSLDAATKETYDLIRVGSDFDRVRENVAMFVRLRNELGKKTPIVRVSFCVTSLNEHELDDFILTWSSVADFFSLQQYGNTFEGRFAEDRGRLFPPGRRYDPGPDPRCAQPWKRVMVRHNGDVIPCCDASGLNLVVGDVFKNSMEDIWRGEKIERLREMHRRGCYFENDICRACMSKWGPPPEKRS